MRLSEREVRPVEELMSEWIANCANLIRQDEFPDMYGDSRPSTPAMRRAAAADNEDAACEYAAHGAGYVEITLAMEGC